ncbi:MAG: helix-turn-helix domain-containing protein [Anaerolineales bacterium]
MSKGSAETLEMRRRIAAKLLQQGHGIRAVARIVGASPASVLRWKRALEQGGIEALKSKPIRHGEVKAFLEKFHQQGAERLVVVLDRYSAHRKALRALQAEGAPGVKRPGCRRMHRS